MSDTQRSAAGEVLRVGPTEPESLESISSALPGSTALGAPMELRELAAVVDDWAFAERVWSGLRPHLRTRLWVLEAVRRRAPALGPDTGLDPEHLKRLAAEVQGVETELDEVLRRRRNPSEFSALLEHRLAPCLSRLEELRQVLHEHGDR